MLPFIIVSVTYNLNYNTLAFIRYYFHIPVSCKLSWALVEETVDGRTEIRLGVVLPKRPGLYVDVAMRRFFTETVLYGGGLVRKVHPARRKADRDEFVYTSASGLTMRTPKGFIRDIYYSSVYSPDMRGPLY